MCHLILALPLVALPVFWVLPLGLALPIYGVTVAFSGWVYYALLRTMHRPASAGRESLLESRGEVVEASGGHARVRVQSEIWNARYRGALQAGDRIRVTAVEGLTLRVAREPESGADLPHPPPSDGGGSGQHPAAV